MAAEQREPADVARSPEPRLDSWKEIAAYLKRHVTTVRRWEKCEGLPVHRHVHEKLGTVYAFRAEIDAWWQSRRSEDRPRRSPNALQRLQGSNARPRRTVYVRRRLALGGAAALSITVIVCLALIGWPDDGRSPSLRSTSEAGATVVATADGGRAARREYQIGRYHLWRDSEENLQRAIAHFERAIEIDPQYAAAYASLAHAWWKRGLWSQTLDATESPARAAAQRALQIDATMPDAYVVLADLERLYGRNLIRAEQLVTRAIALDPNHTDAHYTYGLLLMTLGRFDEAITHMEKAELLDPLSPAIQSDFGRVLYRARRYEDAITRLNRSLELDPRMGWLVNSRLADAYEQLGQYDSAVAALERAGENGFQSKARRARVLARMGRHREAEQLLSEVENSAARHEIAAAYVALGDYDKAFTLLFDRLERAEPGPNFIAVDPVFDRLHSDPRWQDLLRRMGWRNCDACRTGEPGGHGVDG